MQLLVLYQVRYIILVANIILIKKGGVAAILTLPLDVVKTRKQLNPNEYINRSNLTVLYDIYNREGFYSLFTGKRIHIKNINLSARL